MYNKKSAKEIKKVKSVVDMSTVEERALISLLSQSVRGFFAKFNKMINFIEEF